MLFGQQQLDELFRVRNYVQIFFSEQCFRTKTLGPHCAASGCPCTRTFPMLNQSRALF
jgi:hypothetical protein